MYSLGIDIGTSGIRAVVMDKHHRIISQAQYGLEKSTELINNNQTVIGYSQKPHEWWTVFEKVLFEIIQCILQQHIKLENITHLAIDGTSGTVLLADQSGTPVSDALMYNDQRATIQAQQIKQAAPDNTAAIGVSSGLAKILWLHNEWLSDNTHSKNSIAYALNQVDWINGKLLGKYGVSDHNNALKMGYNAQHSCWPNWLIELLKKHQFSPSYLPQVILPGQILGTISSAMALHFGLSPELKICAGTTDSTAAIIASGAKEVGQAITSLGSSMVMKIIADTPIFDKKSGIYSQPYGNFWLVGGSSNSGGEVLKQYFSPEQLTQMTHALDFKIKHGKFTPLDLNYYPLSAPGERFPIQDPKLKPKVSPQPSEPLDYFQALLEGMADIETLAYKKLVDLGAPYPKLVRSIGGGAKNNSWRYIREQKLGVSVIIADEQQAAAGAALLAQTTW
ncbi:MAG: FGGY-family carbohydrate kinase [gamma proteobacterium symbiont of Bathyaustriella thionipta]|nr:FGGY-family carbohydrate kinase [gamma proteobacterium symbiont of Bathyaustriella thionipta]MCU7950346.1 FGGY-family carbohydrate kinase [gamma proteobacterium symbiont of Bathyaustriella thionipta]MCU7954970.1 FGGY-family carbohydrate kinase [gamma proteobacterium symbiont of Bathyaustriella thionipta]MCU7956851.1 FGGY-family carbohydrate kinase [gamma proteobacterium symbiont of Bathyaustriella thionipta]MCU7967891.1 FGGY-family carbohydrate kinase [gamma proteobacterium symbiont of Bathy